MIARRHRAAQHDSPYAPAEGNDQPRTLAFGRLAAKRDCLAGEKQKTTFLPSLPARKQYPRLEMVGGWELHPQESPYIRICL